MNGCIIQARMGSTRLPGKAMKKLNDKIPMLKFQLSQLKLSKNIDRIIIATTTKENDNLIVDFCKQNNLEYFRGSSSDVLDIYYQCAKKSKFSIIVRITSDNPLIDPEIVDNVISEYLNSDCDYISTEQPTQTYPLGFAVEIFNFESLEKTWKEAKLPSEREHVTPYIYKNIDLFKQKTHSYHQNFSHLRCTVDTDEDFQLVENIIEKINKRPIQLIDVLELFEKEPSLFKINNHIKHDGYEKSLKEDKDFLKTISNDEKNN